MTETKIRMTTTMRRRFSNLSTNERSSSETNNDNETATASIDYC